MALPPIFGPAGRWGWVQLTSRALENWRRCMDANVPYMTTVTNLHAILDAMGKLRNVYPNVLHLEKPGMIGDSQQQQLRREQLKQIQVKPDSLDA